MLHLYFEYSTVLNTLLQAYSPGLQSYLKGLSVGVQWEIARLVSMKKIGWEDIYIPKLALLRGSNLESGPKVAQVLLDVAAQDSMEFTAAIKQEMEAKVMSAYCDS